MKRKKERKCHKKQEREQIKKIAGQQCGLVTAIDHIVSTKTNVQFGEDIL